MKNTIITIALFIASIFIVNAQQMNTKIVNPKINPNIHLQKGVSKLVFITNPKTEGNLTVNGKSKLSITLENPYVVNLFKDFKMGKYKFNFAFGADYPKEKDRPEFSFFTFKTTVKYNGKIIKTLERKPMTYIPGGDMFLAPETFDFIYILSTIKQDGLTNTSNTGALPSGNYQIILEAIDTAYKKNNQIDKMLIELKVK
jgi:hypothetical protein